MHSMVKSGKPLEEINACKTIMRNIFSKRYKSFAWVFYQPIDATFLGLYDYHLIVKEPMDLSTIRHRLYSNFYLNAVDFARDMRLIFYNTYLYTTPNHVCYDMAKNLQKVFEEMYMEVPLHCANPEVSVWSNSSSELDVVTPWNNNLGNNNINTSLIQPLNKPHVFQQQQQQLETLEISKSIALVPMSAEEDLDLHIKVQQLDGVMLLNVIHMIHQLESLNFVYPNKELEFDVRNLKPHTKRSILAYMASKGITGKRVSRPKNPYN